MKLNNKFIYYNLEEAEEEIQIMKKALKTGLYTHEQYYRSMQHLIHHVNIAWNARTVTDELIENISDEKMDEWSKFPQDIKLV
jgi:hypothetical protein